MRILLLFLLSLPAYAGQWYVEGGLGTSVNYNPIVEQEYVLEEGGTIGKIELGYSFYHYGIKHNLSVTHLSGINTSKDIGLNLVLYTWRYQ